MNHVSEFMRAFRELSPQDISALLKADPKKSREIMELWDDPDDNALTEKEVPTGPSQAASGDGAEKMIEDYSNPAKQEGLSEAYEELGREMSEMRKAIKALTAGVSALLAKAEDEDEDEDEEESKKAAKFLFKQFQKLVKSRPILSTVEKALLSAIKKAEEDEDEEGKKEAEKALKSYRASKAEDMHLEDEDTNQADRPADVEKAEDENEEEEEEARKARREEHEKDKKEEVEKSKPVNQKPGSMAKGNAPLEVRGAENVLIKARSDLTDDVISIEDYNEITQLAQAMHYVESGNMDKNTFGQMLAKASEPAVRYFQ